ncbi:hypothetical protein BpHYR1_020819 [Brachionus plicatilis]|uniref:Uncharacterized protein n=1 Tax=Brachionus plicatilis TaxID=10195 RepID=A0A3M7PCF3_BRAPC|nr:hypothetical protein BpHYR1_020819 [Brachionus plicatilis]
MGHSCACTGVGLLKFCLLHSSISECLFDGFDWLWNDFEYLILELLARAVLLGFCFRAETIGEIFFFEKVHYDVKVLLAVLFDLIAAHPIPVNQRLFVVVFVFVDGVLWRCVVLSFPRFLSPISELVMAPFLAVGSVRGGQVGTAVAGLFNHLNGLVYVDFGGADDFHLGKALVAHFVPVWNHYFDIAFVPDAVDVGAGFSDQSAY